MSSDSAQVWSTDRPAVVEIAPNDRAYAPEATPMPSASRTMARRASADLHSVRADGVPRGAEVVDSLPGRIAGIVVGDHVVERVAAICDLHRAVRAPGGAEQRDAHACTRFGRTGREDWRPVRGAVTVASRRRALVGFEEI